MTRLILLCTAALLLFPGWGPAVAQTDQVPETSGFSGLAMVSFPFWRVESNLLRGAKPIALNDLGYARISSLDEAPSARTSPGVMGGGEINYTFSSTRTQLFLGNRLEDILRMDIVFGLGVRQEVGEAGVIAASYLTTPVDLEFWTDPYIVGEDRVPTGLSFPGWRVRWGGIFGTGLELTVTDRYWRYDEDSSGAWLVSQGRLAPEQQSLLQRNGDILRFMALYRFVVRDRHRLEPAILLVRDHHDGAAIANNGYELKFTYVYANRRVVADVNALYGKRETREIHPVYGVTLEADHLAAGAVLFFPFKKFSSSVMSAFLGGEYFHEDVNVNFYDSSVGMIMAGVIWNHIRR